MAIPPNNSSLSHVKCGRVNVQAQRDTTIYPPIQSHLYTRKSLQLGAALGNTWFVWLRYQLTQERVLLDWQMTILGGLRAAYRNTSSNAGFESSWLAHTMTYYWDIVCGYHEHAKQKVCEFEGKTFKVMHNDDRCLSCGWQFLCLISLFDILPLNRLTCNRRLSSTNTRQRFPRSCFHSANLGNNNIFFPAQHGVSVV